MDGRHVVRLHLVARQSMGGGMTGQAPPRMRADVDMGQPGEGYLGGLG